MCGISDKATGLREIQSPPSGPGLWTREAVWGASQDMDLFSLVLQYGFHMFKRSVALELFSVMFTAIDKYFSCFMEVIDS